MKNEVIKYVFSLGGTTAYSGKERTMFINDPLKGKLIQSIQNCIYNKFGFDLPFQIKTN